MTITIFIFVAVFIIIGILIHSINRNKKEIVITVNKCNSCPFKEQIPGSLWYNCKLQEIIGNKKTYKSLEEMKSDCEVGREFNIKISQIWL